MNVSMESMEIKVNQEASHHVLERKVVNNKSDAFIQIPGGVAVTRQKAVRETGRVNTYKDKTSSHGIEEDNNNNDHPFAKRWIVHLHDNTSHAIYERNVQEYIEKRRLL